MIIAFVNSRVIMLIMFYHIIIRNHIILNIQNILSKKYNHYNT